MFMWFIKRTYGPYSWSKVSQAFYNTIICCMKPGMSVLEFGSSTGHISFRLAREGQRITLLDIRPEPIDEARVLFAKAGVKGRFITDDFLKHDETYDFLWNSGLVQCLTIDGRERLLMHAATLSKNLLLFYPDTDSPGKICGTNRLKQSGVNDAIEYSVTGLPELFSGYYNKVCFGRLQGDKLGLSFDMLWLHGDNT